MGRYVKKNFDYFPMSADFFSGKKIKALKRAHGSVGLLTYIYILCYTYGNGGYEIHVDNLNEFAYDIAESITSTDISKTARRVTESINLQTEIGLLDRKSLARGVITSPDIQRQYMHMCVQSKRKFDKDDLYLLSEVDFSAPENAIYSEEMPIYSEEMPINSEKITQSKVKENIVSKKVSIEREYNNQSCAYARESYDDLLTDFGVVNPVYRSAIFRWIKHLQLNGIKVINDRLETIIVRLDIHYRNNNEGKAAEIDEAISKGYTQLPCERS